MPKGTFLVRDFKKWEFPKKRDVIIGFASLIHSNKWNVKNIVDSCYISLNKGGILCPSLRAGNYHKRKRIDKFGTRIFYYYTPDLIKNLAGKIFKIKFIDRKRIGKQSLFTIILKKI